MGMARRETPARPIPISERINMKKQYADVKVLDEEIVIHPTCNRDHKGIHDVWTGEARIIGRVIINDKEYEFNKVIDVEFELIEKE